MSETQIKGSRQRQVAVVHDGKPDVKGDTVTVPESVAQEWECNGYMERVSRKNRPLALGMPGANRLLVTHRYSWVLM